MAFTFTDFEGTEKITLGAAPSTDGTLGPTLAAPSQGFQFPSWEGNERLVLGAAPDTDGSTGPFIGQTNSNPIVPLHNDGI